MTGRCPNIVNKKNYGQVTSLYALNWPLLGMVF